VNVTRYIFLLLALSLPALANADALQTCLASTVYHEHRIEKEDNINFCFEKYKNSISQDSCFKTIRKNSLLINTSKLHNFTTSVCFYETGEHKNLYACNESAKKFKGAAEHDEALFYCYQTFQDRVSKKDCLETSAKMIFPAKKEYLKRHCLRN
jgi:hypothetical protein